MSNDFTATLPRKRMGAAVLLSDAHGRVLLVEPIYKPYCVKRTASLCVKPSATGRCRSSYSPHAICR